MDWDSIMINMLKQHKLEIYRVTTDAGTNIPEKNLHVQDNN